MVSDRCKVDRAVDLGRDSLLAVGVGQGDDLTLGVLVGAVWVVFLIKKSRIENIGVDMKIPENGNFVSDETAQGASLACADRLLSIPASKPRPKRCFLLFFVPVFFSSFCQSLSYSSFLVIKRLALARAFSDGSALNSQ